MFQLWDFWKTTENVVAVGRAKSDTGFGPDGRAANLTVIPDIRKGAMGVGGVELKAEHFFLGE